MELGSQEHFFNPRLELIDLIKPLLDLADRFSCTMEMATFLAILLVGGPKKFFRWYCDPSGQGRSMNTIPREFQESFLLCNDDLELALLLMRTWFQAGSTYQEREKWEKKWQIKHKSLIYAVEHKRDQMLADRFYKQSDGEYIRPVDLRLIPKVRLLIAYHLVTIERLHRKQEQGLAVKGGIYRSGSSSQQIRIHRDSVCYGSNGYSIKNFVYFFPDQERGLGELEAQQVVAISSKWLDWLQKAERDEYELALFIADETRYEEIIDVVVQPDIVDIFTKSSKKTRNEEKQGRWRGQDTTFLDQNISQMLVPFAIQERRNQKRRNQEGIKMKPYYNPGGVCGIAQPSVSKELLELEVGQIYRGKITHTILLPNFFQAQVELPNGLSGILYESGLWGQCNDLHNDEHIRINNTIPVCIKFINKQTGYIELYARLPGLNPLEKFHVGQEIEGTVVQVEKARIFVRIHDRVKPIPCKVHESYAQAIQNLLKEAQKETREVTVKVVISEVIPREERIKIEIADKSLLSDTLP